MTLEWDNTLIEKVKKAAMVGVVRGTNRIKNAAVAKIMTGPKTGRLYRRRSVVHQASAPGEPPASDTGRLAKSGRVEFDHNELQGKVIFSTEYAEGLEFGTERVDPRPFLRPSLSENADAVKADIQKEIGRVLK